MAANNPFRGGIAADRLLGVEVPRCSILGRMNVTATLLATHRVDKPWGRHTLWAGFANPPADAEPVGEIWFQTPGNAAPDLLVKYLFTSEKLSVQVHPDDAQARARGLPRGKDECWVVLDAEADSTIALGTKEPIDRDTLRAAALDGSIEELLDWKPVKAGDFFYSASGTVHAIGAGVTIIEIQQNSETTYRLYDYGRPRELHLDMGVAVSNPEPYVSPVQAYLRSDRREILADGQMFVLERWHGAVAGTLLPEPQRPLWLVPVSGSGRIAGGPLEPGSVWLVDGAEPITLDRDSELLIAYPGAAVHETLLS